MLTQTFVHIHGVGYKTERALWRLGADCWQTFLGSPAAFAAPRLAGMEGVIRDSVEALARGDSRFFQRHLHARDHWRAFPEFRERALYLDIETTGSGEFSEVTVIGIHDGVRMRQFVRGENLLEAEEALEETDLFVTFFGTGFDLPVLRQLFPRLKFDVLHVDLCHTLRRLGYKGGLKAVERQLGLERAPEITGLDGLDAVRLWFEHLHGSEEAREALLAYNRADVENMLPLAQLAYRELRAKTLAHESS